MSAPPGRERLPGDQGWFWEEEGRAYAEFAAGLRGGSAVEVGCWKGLSASYIGPVCRDNGTRFYCVDWWLGSCDRFAPAYGELLAREDVPAAFSRNMARLGIPARVLRLESAAAAARFADASLDLVFLDASHDAASVAADLRAWHPKLRPGGVLAGHDLCAKTPGVARALAGFRPASGRRLRRGPGRLWSLRKGRS